MFDLDDTLYPTESNFMRLVEVRMTAFVARELGLGHDDAYAMQKRYLRDHGTTLAGLMAHHGTDPQTFLDEVHDVPLDALDADPEPLLEVARPPGRRLVFTNGDERHARRVLERFDLSDAFGAVFHIGLADHAWKPDPRTLREKDRRPRRRSEGATAFFEDLRKRTWRLDAALGMTSPFSSGRMRRSRGRLRALPHGGAGPSPRAPGSRRPADEPA